MQYGIISAAEQELDPFLTNLIDVNIERYAILNFHIGKYYDMATEILNKI